jgi:hypothetical protein
VLWQPLGIVVPRINEWRNYSPSTLEYPSPLQKALYRITPEVQDPLATFWTYALVRFAFDDGDQLNYSPSFRVYPRGEAVIREVTLPTGVDISPFTWVPQVRKFIRPSYRGRNAETQWSVKLEEFIPQPDAIVDTIGELSDQITRTERFDY